MIEVPHAQTLADRFASEGKPGMLAGLRVVEIADELGEYCGLLLAGLGAEVIKIEPPGGSPTRQIGPFAGDDVNPEKSLFFWNYNRGKKSVVFDACLPADRDSILKLVGGADILLDSSAGEFVRELALERPLTEQFPSLIVARLTAFGDTGPWKDFKGSDLIHLALGGVMMNCGYDADPFDRYDVEPIAPQVWHAYHIAGEQLATGIVAAILHRERTGKGQDLSCAVHEAVSKNTELDLMSWVMRRAPLYRQTARHAVENPNRSPSVSHTKDGRWYMTWGVSAKDKANLVPFLDRYGMAADLQAPSEGADLTARSIPGSGPNDDNAMHTLEVIQRFVRSFRYENVPWQEAQDAGLLWAPVRKPHENAMDDHWLQRGTFSQVEHPEFDCSFQYSTSKWLSTATAWQTGRRAPLLGEDNDEIRVLIARQEVAASTQRINAIPRQSQSAGRPLLSPHGHPFPLQDIRILDFSWFLASAGGTRFLASLGAESLKVEWKANPDTRLAAMAPVGGIEARRRATGPLEGVTDPDMGGQFNNKNSGKRGLSLNLRHPKGLAIAKELVRQCDIVAEGFSPGVLERLGLGYDVLRSIKPDIIYVQQSGMGSAGSYGRFRTVGPIAASFAGTTEMSGLPSPAMPAGWGYSYLDWVGAYGFALATMGALYHRERTGQGQWIDSSQCEAGIFQNGIATLDWSVNQREWQRYGNRSPYKRAAPHGAYRCLGDDRWITIACSDEGQWGNLVWISGLTQLADDPRFATLAARLLHQDLLDATISSWTQGQEAFACMQALQAAGVPAGVCQTAQDRCDTDPQLAALNWLTMVKGTKIGTWPVAEFPVKFSATPAHSGGPIGRGAPCYGEDNRLVLSSLLGMSASDIQELEEQGVI